MKLIQVHSLGGCFSCCNPKTSVAVSIPQGGFAVGQKIPVKIDCVNNSNTDIQRINIRLMRSCIYVSSTPHVKLKEEKLEKIVAIYTNGIESGATKSILSSIEVPQFLAASNGRLCSVIRIEYFIQVEGLTGWCGKSFKMLLPITIFKRSEPIETVHPPEIQFPTAPLTLNETPVNDLRKMSYTFF